MRTPVLIFDFGNVVAHFDYARACEPLAAPLGLTGSQLLERCRERGFTPLLHQFEAGRIGEHEFSRLAREIVGTTVDHETFVAAWQDIFWINEPVAELIAGLKERGYRLLLGSNTNVIHATYYRRKFARELAVFENFVLSYEVGAEKPSARFYEVCAQTAGVPPGECLFVDDMPENVDGARRTGLQAVLYRDVAGLRRDLAGAGVDIPPS